MSGTDARMEFSDSQQEALAAAHDVMPTFHSQATHGGQHRAPVPPGKRLCAAGAAEDDDGFVAIGGDTDLMAYVDTTKDAIMSALEQAKKDMAKTVTDSIGTLATTVSNSCKSLGTQVERRCAAVEFKVAAHEERFNQLDGKIAELQRLVGVLRTEEPAQPNIADRSAFDRKPDGALLVARTRTLCTMDAYKAVINPILEQNNLAAGEYEYEGSPASSRIQIRIKGAAGYASRRVAQIIGSQRLSDRQWARHTVEDTTGTNTDLFLDSDKSPCQIKREQLVKAIRKACSEAYPTKKFFADRTKGTVSVGWKPIIMVNPNPGDAQPSVKWCEQNLVSERIDRNSVATGIAHLVDGPEPVQWS